jgi:type II secretory pathway pseudopilin PulG
MNPSENHRIGRCQTAGLTLVELVLSLTIIGMIGASIAGMFFFTSYAISKQSNARDLLVAVESVGTRMSEAVQRSKMVLAKGSDYLVLWTADSNKNGSPDLSELRRIELATASNTITSYKAPAGLSPDTTYSLTTTDFNAVTNSLKGTSSFPGQAWGMASSWATVLDNASVQQANYVGWRITLTSNGDTEIAIGGAALRN